MYPYVLYRQQTTPRHQAWLAYRETAKPALRGSRRPCSSPRNGEERGGSWQWQTQKQEEPGSYLLHPRGQLLETPQSTKAEWGPSEERDDGSLYNLDRGDDCNRPLWPATAGTENGAKNLVTLVYGLSELFHYTLYLD